MTGRKLALPQPILQAMVADALRRAPDEAVGLLGGRDELAVSRCIPLPNRLSGRAYWVDPFAQWQALMALKQDGLVPMATYHSHPEGSATLSLADRTFASGLGLFQVVISLINGRVSLAAYDVDARGEVMAIPLFFR